MSSSTALPQTLKSINATKVSEISKNLKLFNSRKEEVLKAAAAATDLREKASILLRGVAWVNGYSKKAFEVDALEDDDLDQDIVNDSDDEDPAHEKRGNIDDALENAEINVRRFLLQSKFDNSVSDELLKEWTEQLEQKLELISVRYDHAVFYSDLVAECLTDLDGRAEKTGSEDEGDGDHSNVNTKAGNDSESESFEHVGRSEMHEQRATWESLVFKSADVDVSKLEEYLTSLFSSTKLSKQALKELREKIKWSSSMVSSTAINFTTATLKTVSESLLRADILSPEKVAVLKEFTQNDDIANEVVDVIRLRFASLESWSWGPEGIPVEMRRQLNGKYRVFMDEDLLDALLLEYIGLRWAVIFRSVFDKFLHTKAWKSNSKPIPKERLRRRRHFLGDGLNSSVRVPQNLYDKRRAVYEKEYFMNQLPMTIDEGGRDYNGDNAGESGAKNDPVKTKHSLLHLLIAESLIHTTLRDEFTVLRSDFKWFGPSLSHDAILTVLKFFGLTDEWLSFFQKFLETPMKFSQDGPDAKPQIRKRGVPMSHSLSDVFGETILFCMDYAVNQHANGEFLYRLHDDFWFWGDEETCRKAWKAMEEFAGTIGLEFNEEKTGTVRLGKKKGGIERDTTGHSSDSSDSSDSSSSDDDDRERSQESSKELDDPLPKGEIRWGFLKLDAEHGSFVIDQSQVDTHIQELRRQLAACKSVFAWVRAWNSYFARFFSNNFATPSKCFGRTHIDMVISTLHRIEREVFVDESASKHTGELTRAKTNVTDYLRKRIAERFDVHDLPEGFFYFPVELGGLELRNPFISFLGLREDIKKTPQHVLHLALLKEEESYHNHKEKYEKSGSPLSSEKDPDGNKEKSTFFPLSEYMLHLESTSRPLLQAYLELLQIPEEVPVKETPELQRSQTKLRELTQRKVGAYPLETSLDNWNGMKPYWKWVAELYQAGMIRKYGSLAAVDRSMMPLGVVKVLRRQKVRWQG